MSAPISSIRPPLVEGNKTYHQITEDICSPTERTPSFSWIVAFIVAVTFLALYIFLCRVDRMVWNWYVEFE